MALGKPGCVEKFDPLDPQLVRVPASQLDFIRTQ
jgi:hypothetical protein